MVAKMPRSLNPNDLLKRGLIVMNIEVINSNPNGDPDTGGHPREIHIGGNSYGVISAVSIKRKLRDILMKDFGKVLAKKVGLSKAQCEILENPDHNRQELIDSINKNGYEQFANRFWDARVFGNTFLEQATTAATATATATDDKTNTKKKEKNPRKNKHIRTGVVQFTQSFSVAPIETECFTTTKMLAVENDKDKGMAPSGTKFVKHGVYSVAIFINSTQSKGNGCTQADIELMKLMIPLAYRTSRSSGRPNVNIQNAYYIEFRNSLGGYDQQIFKSLIPVKKTDPNTPSISLDEYEFPGLDNPTIKKYGSKITSVTDLMDYDYEDISYEDINNCEDIE